MHFSDVDEGTFNDIDPLLETITSANPMEELVPSAHKRTLDEWCFAEHLDRHVLLQVAFINCFSKNKNVNFNLLSLQRSVPTAT